MNFAFSKYHALGNDYIVMDPKNLPAPLTTEQVKMICHRNFGVGSDGILLGPLPSSSAKCAPGKIYNPDGSVAEKSGNGLRIFSRYLWDTKFVGNDEFAIQTDGGLVRSTLFLMAARRYGCRWARSVLIALKIPVNGPRREVINEKITVEWTPNSLFVRRAIGGDPHCVLPLDEISSKLAHEFGPLLEVT